MEKEILDNNRKRPIELISAGNKRARLDRRNQKDRDRRKNESEEDKNTRLAKRRQRDRARRTDETPKQRGARLVKMSTQQQKRHASETPEARDARLEQLIMPASATVVHLKGSFKTIHHTQRQRKSNEEDEAEVSECSSLCD